MTNRANLRSELVTLSRHLRQERLFVSNEKESLGELNEKVQNLGKELSQAAWIDHQQRVNLHNLIFNHSEPSVSCRRANTLEQTIFTDASKELHQQEGLYSEFLRNLRDKPRLLAHALVQGDKSGYPSIFEIESTIFAGLYGSCLMHEDEVLTLELLHSLMMLQISVSSDPRRLLRKGNCAFSRLYKAFNDQIFSAKLFLTSALYDPILSLLTDDEIFLDIDPSKTILRFPPSDVVKKFGVEGSSEFNDRVKSYRRFIIGKLENLTRKFIDGIRNNLHCFPPALSTLLRSLYSLLVKSFEPKICHSICVDLVFYLFICPALVDPNPVGIIDAPISYIARSNLMQVAQILQVLCLRKWEDIDSAYNDLYSRFDKNIMAPILEAIWDTFDKNNDTCSLLPSVSTGGSRDDGKLSRLSVLMTPQQLNQLIDFLRASQPFLSVSEVSSELESLLASLPFSQVLSPKGNSEFETVLVLSISLEENEIPGSLSEELVLSRAAQNSKNRVVGSESTEKRTRFSLSHDEGSIGNTSDNLEAISEAASNHSVASSCDDEGNPGDDRIDNLSDMVSANVSGRGTPNVSGRDTPSSQVVNDDDEDENDDDDDDDDGGDGEQISNQHLSRSSVKHGNHHHHHHGVIQSSRNNVRPPDLEEKFGRFEIKSNTGSNSTHRKEIVDETVSLISDTWSTDVFVSDTEPLGEERQGVDFEDSSINPLLDDLVVPPLASNPSSFTNLRPFNNSSSLPYSGDNVSEVWSMDVLASDSESLRLGELDNEDTTSVAQSDDTRFTDDTTRSDPPEPLYLPDGHLKSGIKNRISSHSDSVEQWARLSVGRRSSDSGPRKGRGGGGMSKNTESVEFTSVSSGGIPKSISFDKSASSELEKKRSDKSFFKNWKLPKIGRKNSGRSVLGETRHSENVERAVEESSDEILAKYRSSKPNSSTMEPIAGDSSSHNDSLLDERLYIDPHNIGASYAFQDAKRKLRLMLSSADLSMLNDLNRNYSQTSDNEVVWLLKVQLAEAHNLGDRNLVAVLHETLRCLSLFDTHGVSLLVSSLRSEYKRRSPYISYLVRCRQGVLCSLSYQERLLSRMNVDRSVCSFYLVSVIVRLFLEKRERTLNIFVNSFKNSSVADEKTSLMEAFLSSLRAELRHDEMWKSASESQLELAHIAIERSVTSHIYNHALYPNGDGDVSRDEVLSQHIRRLSLIITPGHKDLKIPLRYHYETPWPSAQAEIRRLAAFKIPSDKVACVLRMSQIILNLLSLNRGKAGAPAADDFVPVLVFVLIKANPPSLLSSIQYVNSFYGNRLRGEEQYWWTQFVSAIEFIKTMDYA